jgi:putative peptide zinc metalloprotease protein
MTDIGPHSHVALYDLDMRVEQRDDAPEWIVGRRETGVFIAVPDIAADVIRLIRTGLTVAETADRIKRDQDRDVDVTHFVSSLAELGFVRTVDGVALPGGEPVPATLPWLRTRHVRWLLTPPVASSVAGLVSVAIIAVLVDRALLPDYRDLLWSGHTTVVLAGNAVVAWSIVGLHELAHLLTARAAGVGGRIGFGTRLQFLVVQTDVSGIWAAARNSRMMTYLAGMIVNISVAAVAVLTRAITGPEPLAGRLAAATAVVSLTFLPFQLLLFMRTDLYFVLQDLAGCRNLYGDGSAYVRYWMRRVWRIISAAGPAPVNPLGVLPARERTAVRAYAVVLLVGTAACLAVAAAVTAPFTLSLVARAFAGLTGERGTAGLVDAVSTAVLASIYWVLWGIAWWRRHGDRVTGLLRRTAPQREQTDVGRR